MNQSRRILGLAVGAAILASGLAAGAQAQPAPAQAQRGMMGHDPAEMAARHAERLRTVLQLRPDQEPALKALLASMAPPADMRERMQERRDEMAGLTTPQRLDRMQAMMADHQAAFAKRADAVRRFYAQLTPSQQKAFDALPPMHGGRHGMGMGGKGGKGGMGRGGMDHGGMGHGGMGQGMGSPAGHDGAMSEDPHASHH